MNRSASLHTYDFATTPYDGDARQAHQLIPFIQSKLGAKQLSYILNTHEYPDPKTEPLLVILESQHNENMDTLTLNTKSIETTTSSVCGRSTREQYFSYRQMPRSQSRANTPTSKHSKFQHVLLFPSCRNLILQTPWEISSAKAETTPADLIKQPTKLFSSFAPSSRPGFSTNAQMSYTITSTLHAKSSSPSGTGYSVKEHSTPRSSAKSKGI